MSTTLLKRSAPTLNQQKILILFTLASALLSIMRFDTIPVGSFFDDAHYIVLAESLSSGRGYRLINFPYAPVERAFPPGWPLMLAPLVKVFPENFTVLKLPTLFFWLASLPLIYRLFARHLRSPYIEALLALVALNPVLVGMSGTVMSEPAYLFFSLLTLILFEAWNRGDKENVWLLVTSFLAAFSALLIRTVGVSLLAAMLLYPLAHYRRRFLSRIWAGLISILIPLVLFSFRNAGTLILSPEYREHIEAVAAQLVNYSQFWKYSSFISFETLAGSLIPISLSESCLRGIDL